MARTCANHGDRVAEATCRRCGKGVCRECAVVRADGSFCSAECSLQYSGSKAGTKGTSGGRLGVVGCTVLLVLLFLGFFVIVHALSGSFPEIRSLDLLGELLEGLRAIFRNGS